MPTLIAANLVKQILTQIDQVQVLVPNFSFDPGVFPVIQANDAGGNRTLAAAAFADNSQNFVALESKTDAISRVIELALQAVAGMKLSTSSKTFC